MKQIRIGKPKPRRCKRVDGEDEANVVLRANATVARARDLSDRLHSLADDVDIALEQVEPS